MLVGLAVCGGLVWAMSMTTTPGWILGAVVAATLVLAIPLGVKRYPVNRPEPSRTETLRKLARSLLILAVLLILTALARWLGLGLAVHSLAQM